MYHVREYYNHHPPPSSVAPPPPSPQIQVKMDPDCAICHAPASVMCDCESKSLDSAVRQAESRMIHSLYGDIRSWVRGRAQDYILEYFSLLTDQRRQAHTAHMDRITSHAYQVYYAPPHPTEVAAAQAILKRGIDEDWKTSVQRYPEVLDYFYSLVQFSVPADDDPAVRDPPLSALGGGRKVSRRSGVNAPAIAPGPSMERELLGRKTPPQTVAPPRNDRRTPGPPARDHRHPHPASFGRPQPAPSYYSGPGPSYY